MQADVAKLNRVGTGGKVGDFPEFRDAGELRDLRADFLGQTRPVTVDNVASDGEGEVLKSRKRKAEQAERMFDSLVEHMRNGMGIARGTYGNTKEEVPSWLCSTK